MSDIFSYCPKCKAKHTTKATSIGETFKCDSCQHQFIIDESSSSNEKKVKIYPGVKKGIDLGDVDLAIPVTVVDKKNNSSRYAKEKVATIDSFNLGPLHFIAIAVAVIVFIVGFFLIYVGHKPGGIIFEFNNHKRMYMALFLSILSFIGCVYGFKHKWKWGAIVGIIFGGVLCGMVVSYKDTFKSEREHIYRGKAMQGTPEKIVVDKDDLITEEKPKSYREKIHYSVFQNAKNESEENSVFGAVLYGSAPQYDDDIRDFFTDSLGDEASVNIIHSKYMFDEKSALLLIVKHRTEQKEKVVRLIKALVSNLNFDSKLGLYIANLSPLVINPHSSVDMDKLGVLESFGKLSNEIIHLNRGRQESALLKITQANQVVYAAFILDNLTVALNSRDLIFQTDVVVALHHWRTLLEQPRYNSLKIDDFIKAADEAVNQLAVSTLKSDVALPIEISTYLIDFKVKQAKKSIFEAWKKTPISLEKSLTRSKGFAQYLLEGNLSSCSTSQLISALSILRVVGNEKILPELEALKKSNNDKKIEDSLRSTIDVIKNRP